MSGRDESWYKHVFEATTSGIFIYDVDGRLLEVNPTACRLHGRTRDELLAMDPREFIHPSTHHIFAAFRETVLRGEVYVGEARGVHADGSTFDVEVTGTLMELDGRPALFSSLIDITQRKRLADQLARAQRLEALGTLAGGIAHDFNNLLAVVLGYAELLADALDPDDPRRRDVEQIRIAGDRASDLTSKLVAFGRQQILDVRVLDLRDVVRAIAPMLSRVLGGAVHVDVDVPSAAAPVRADVAQLDQVILNLAINAGHAMPHGGRLLLEVEEVELDDAYAALHEHASPGPHVVLTVSDTGCGIPDDVIRRVFEPFFTTRRDQGGSGLGLSMVFGNVTQLGGHVTVYSEVGVGTTFRIYLPRAEGVAIEGPRPDVAPAAAGGKETLILVDDDDAVRRLVASALGGAGYHVVACARPVDALALHDDVLAAAALLVTDVVMPDLDGRELHVALAARHPGLPALFMSGYTENVVVRRGFLKPGVDFLHKPFSVRALLARVRAAIDGAVAAR